MTGPALRLRPATPAEFGEWLPRQVASWVYDVEIDPAYSGRGYGRAAMLLAEAEARSAGMTSIGLNVHGQNAVARSLYDSLGYAVMALQMKKPL